MEADETTIHEKVGEASQILECVMIEIIIIMVTGIIIGYLLREKRAIFTIIDRIVMAVIFLLLFVLGISVGLNETVVGTIHIIGIKALILTLGAVAGSIACCCLVWRLFFTQQFDAEVTDER